MIYGICSTIDCFAGIILQYVPLYWLFKILFLIYLFNPFTLGATVIYEKVLTPLANQYRPQINKIAKQLHSLSEDYSENLKQAGNIIKDAGVEAILKQK